MQIEQLSARGLQLIPVKEFSETPSVEFDGSLQEFIDTVSNKGTPILFFKGKTVGEIILNIVKENGQYGYTADMSNRLLSAMLYLSNLPTHKLELCAKAIEEIKHIKSTSTIQIPFDLPQPVAEYQLAMAVDGVLLKSPIYQHKWIEQFKIHCFDILQHESRMRIAQMVEHNAHLKVKTSISLANCA